MQILVTGGNGQLGNEFRRISVISHEVTFTFIDIDELDIAQETQVKDFFESHNFDFVINCAAYTAVDKAEEESVVAFQANADAVKYLATACLTKGIRLIHVSTDYVFDGNSNVPIKEQQVPNPLSVYGKSKLAGEKHITSMLPDAYIVRTAWVYSTFGKNFVKTIVRLAREKETLNVIADQFGSPTYARDLAFTIFEIVKSIISGKKDVPGIYHYTNEGAISWYDFAWFIVRYYQLPCRVMPITTEEYKTLAVRPRFSVLDKGQLKTTFGIKIPHWYDSLLQCLKDLDQ